MMLGVNNDMNIDEIFLEGNKLPNPLSKQEQYQLLEKMQQGDSSARKKLIEHNIRLVLYEVSNRFKTVKYDKKDLVSIGNIGLIKAISTFDISKNVVFSTYAIKCIDNEILSFLSNLNHRNTISLEETLFENEDGKMRLKDIITDEVDIDNEYTNKETCKIIRQMVNDLPENKRNIIMLYFGFYDDRVYTQKEIANMMNVTQATISKTIILILEELSKKLQQMGVIEIKEKEKTSKPKKDYSNIYNFFNQYTKDEIDSAIENLTEKEQGLIRKRYGDDLTNPIFTKLNPKENNYFYNALIPKMKEMLESPNLKIEPKKIKTIYDWFESYTKEEIDRVIDDLPDEEKILIMQRYNNDLNNPTFGKLSKQESNRFYNNLMPRIRKMLACSNIKLISERKKETIKENESNEDNAKVYKLI